MTHKQIIAELVRIWHSPHLDLSLKAGLAEAIETLKEKNRSDSLVTDSSDACKESKSKLDLISREAVLDFPIRLDHYDEEHGNRDFVLGIESVMEYVESLPSAESKTKCIAQIRIDRDDMEDLVNEKVNEIVNEIVDKIAEPKTGKWVKVIDQETPNVTKWHYECDQCGAGRFEKCQKYCSRCGAKMVREDGEA